MTGLGDVGGHETELSAGLDVQVAVPDDRARREIDVPVVARLLEEPSARFAAVAMRFGSVGAIVEGVDVGTVGKKKLVQPLVDAFDIRPRVEPALHPRLIGHTDDQKPMVPGERKGVTDPTEHFDPFRLPKVLEVRVQGSVTVHKEGPTNGPGAERVESGVAHREAMPLTA